MIPELQSLDFKSTDNEKSIEQLVNLQTLLCEIDQNLKHDRFNALEKIKTIGSVYMVASGLHENIPDPPRNRLLSKNTSTTSSIGIYSSGGHQAAAKRFSFMSNTMLGGGGNQRDNFHVKSEEQGKRELCQLAEFAINFRFTILRFNKENGTNFNVQIGLAYGGQVVAGVVGKDTPQYDIQKNEKMDKIGFRPKYWSYLCFIFSVYSAQPSISHPG